MRPDIARAALAFLKRCDLKGGEVPAYNAVVATLEALANPPFLPATETDNVVAFQQADAQQADADPSINQEASS